MLKYMSAYLACQREVRSALGKSPGYETEKSWRGVHVHFIPAGQCQTLITRLFLMPGCVIIIITRQGGRFSSILLVFPAQVTSGSSPFNNDHSHWLLQYVSKPKYDNGCSVKNKGTLCTTWTSCLNKAV